ncbi:hypothetical protein GA0115240_16751, partial [Streptomyces sp. DvalAA-14]
VGARGTAGDVPAGGWSGGSREGLGGAGGYAAARLAAPLGAP